MPKILAYVHAYIPKHNAGAETTIHDLLRYLVNEGWEAQVLVKDSDKEEYEIDGVKVNHGDRKALIPYVANSDITISHLECSERTHLVSRMWGKPSIHLVHNNHPLTKRWSASATGLIYNTQWISQDEKFAAHNRTMPSIILHPAVDPEQYKTKKGKGITLVNLWEDKGAGIFYYLAAENPQLPFYGVIGGYGEQKIASLDNVTILEHTSDMKSVYEKTKVLLMPSRYESFGRVGVEAMASGIPVLAHPTEGLRESLADAGTFADRSTPAEWKKSLTELLKPAKYGKMSKLALARSSELKKQTEMELEILPQFLKEQIRAKSGRRS